MVDLARFLVGEPHSVSARLKTFTATEGFTNVLVTEPHQPFMRHWWPSGHIIGWEHTFVHKFAHLLEAIVAGTSVAPYGATFEDGYRAAVVCEAIADAARERTEVRVTY